MARVSRRVRTSEHLIVKWSPALLKMELDRWFWKERDHVSVGDYVGKCRSALTQGAASAGGCSALSRAG